MPEIMFGTRDGAMRRERSGTRMRALFAIAMLAACSSPTGSDAVADVVVTPSTLTLGIGTQMPVSAQVRDASGNLVPAAAVVWTVQDSRIASVSSSGVVTGVALGSTQIAANANGKSGIATVNVQRTPVASVVVLPNPANVIVGLTTPLRAITYDAALNELTGRTIVWSSSNDAIARVDGNGLVTGVATGSVTITATSEGKSGTSTVAVAPPPVVSVTVTPPATTLIALSHLGLHHDRILAARVPRLDLILGGHSHDTLPQPEVVAGVPIVHAGPYGTFASRTELSKDDAGRARITGFALEPLT